MQAAKINWTDTSEKGHAKPKQTDKEHKNKTTTTTKKMK